MDGTIIDTEPYWMAAETELVESFGGTWTHEEAVQLVGSGMWHSARVIRSKGVDMGERDIIEWMTSRVLDQVRASVPWRPGARDLLAELQSHGVKTALVTMSIRRLAEHVASAIDFAPFDVIVSGDDVQHAKPHPQPYLMAAELLSVDPLACVVIEDSEPGVASGTASGAATIGVPHVIALREHASYDVWPTLDGRTVADLADVLHARRTA